MTNLIPQHLVLRLTTILWFLGIMAFLLSLPILVQASPLILVGIACVALVLAAPLAWIGGRLRRKRAPAFTRSWVKTAIMMSLALGIALAAPILYFATITQTTPALVPQATLSDGRRTIVFQGMQHVGIERFYKSVVYDLEDALSRGYVLYYEGVKPADAASNAWLANIVTGGTDLASSYRTLGSLCGLQFQSDYFGMLGRDAQAHPASHVVADVDTAQLKAEYERLMLSDPSFVHAMRAKSDKAAPGEGGAAGMEKIVAFLKAGTTGQREIAGILCRGFMTRAMTRASSPQSTDELDKLIVDFRNRALVDRLLADNHSEIYLTYGAKHLPGVLRLLQRNDPKWRITSLKWMRTIDSPERLEGRL